MIMLFPCTKNNNNALSLLLLVQNFLLLLFLLKASPSFANQFNFEVEKRILDRLTFYLDHPVKTNEIVLDYRNNEGFPNMLQPPDRTAYNRFVFSLKPQGTATYYGLEDGTFAYNSLNLSLYREPGQGGYALNDDDIPIDDEMIKYYHACVNKVSGEPIECKLDSGDSYIQCLQDDCTQLVPCPDVHSQAPCEKLAFEEDRIDCFRKIKYCTQYTIETIPTSNQQQDESSTVATTTPRTSNAKLGYVPLTEHCISSHGIPSQDHGNLLSPDGSGGLGNCYYEDGTTLVKRNLQGPYAFCGPNGDICDNTFEGGRLSLNYDPRYRPWYIQTKKLQKPNWSPPYPFLNLGMGITFSSPMYTTKIDNDGNTNQVFAGVVAFDYRFSDLTDFLVDNYGGTDTFVAIYEDAEPNYVIALSTATPASNLVVTSDPSQPCPVDIGRATPCTPTRIAMSTLHGMEEDDVLVRAFYKQRSAGYPQDLVSVTSSDDVNSDFYISQSTLYEQSGANLKWRVIIVAPGTKIATDAIETGSVLFATLCIISGIGFIICIVILIMFYAKRKQAAVIHADWRFTCAFIFGCALLNIAILSQLGPNNDEICLIRMWAFHLLFVVALAPLFVKVWRMQQLVGSTQIRRVTISNVKTAIYMLPMILAQAIILTIFTFIDPPKQTEIIDTIEGAVSQRIICQTETNALFVVEFVFEAGFVLAGCVLAYMTRNMDAKYGEAKQLIFAMYNIALVGLIIIIVVMVGGINPNGTSVLMAMGLLWGTIFSSAAFVVPRIIQVHQDIQRSSNSTEDASSKTTTLGNVQISGLEAPQV